MDGSIAVQDNQVLAGLTGLMQDAVAATDTYKSALHKKVGAVLAPDGKIDRTAFSANQHLAHGYELLFSPHIPPSSGSQHSRLPLPSSQGT